MGKLVAMCASYIKCIFRLGTKSKSSLRRSFYNVGKQETIRKPKQLPIQSETDSRKVKWIGWRIY
jgi:hypothetical protein